MDVSTANAPDSAVDLALKCNPEEGEWSSEDEEELLDYFFKGQKSGVVKTDLDSIKETSCAAVPDSEASTADDADLSSDEEFALLKEYFSSRRGHLSPKNEKEAQGEALAVADAICPPKTMFLPFEEPIPEDLSQNAVRNRKRKRKNKSNADASEKELQVATSSEKPPSKLLPDNAGLYHCINPHCTFVTLAYKGALKHIRLRIKGRAETTCHVCGLRFCIIADLTNHLRAVHPDEALFNCEFCGKAYIKKDPFLRHRSNCAPGMSELRFKCPIPQCGKTANKRNTIRSHLNVAHLQLRFFQCGICDDTFTVKACAERHAATQHLKDVQLSPHRKEGVSKPKEGPIEKALVPESSVVTETPGVDCSFSSELSPQIEANDSITTVLDKSEFHLDQASESEPKPQKNESPLLDARETVAARELTNGSNPTGSLPKPLTPPLTEEVSLIKEVYPIPQIQNISCIGIIVDAFEQGIMDASDLRRSGKGLDWMKPATKAKLDKLLAERN